MDGRMPEFMVSLFPSYTFEKYVLFTAMSSILIMLHAPQSQAPNKKFDASS